MRNYLNPQITDILREISAQGLAHIGDAVFELMVRTYLCMSGTWSAGKLHDKTVKYVSAKAQANASGAILPLLNEEETEVYKRGRNTQAKHTPKNSTNEEYNKATGIEALFGYLYLSGNTARLNELFEAVIDDDSKIRE